MQSTIGFRLSQSPEKFDPDLIAVDKSNMISLSYFAIMLF
jgi:hypothetical protein